MRRGTGIGALLCCGDCDGAAAREGARHPENTPLITTLAGESYKWNYVVKGLMDINATSNNIPNI
jgi:hypothetical protein